MPTLERVVKFIGCPAPINGYIRTPSMWRQIESLSTPDSQFQDYHVRRTSALSVAALTFLQFDNAPNGRTRSIRQYVSFTHPVVRRGILLHALSIFQAPIFLFTPAQIVFLMSRGQDEPRSTEQPRRTLGSRDLLNAVRYASRSIFSEFNLIDFETFTSKSST
jgi:hypothetical protein